MIGPFRVFVYGTLMQGECRERLWPHLPQEVCPASVAGAIYDLGPYPALVAGQDRVAGQLWTFPTAVIAETLAALDAIEGYQQNDGPDLYCRTILHCAVADGARGPGTGAQGTDFGPPPDCLAWGYLYAQPAMLQKHQRISPAADGYCRWSPS